MTLIISENHFGVSINGKIRFTTVHFLIKQSLPSPQPSPWGRGRNYSLSQWADRVPHFLLDTGKLKKTGELVRDRRLLNSPPGPLS